MVFGILQKGHVHAIATPADGNRTPCATGVKTVPSPAGDMPCGRNRLAAGTCKMDGPPPHKGCRWSPIGRQRRIGWAFCPDRSVSTATGVFRVKTGRATHPADCRVRHLRTVKVNFGSQNNVRRAGGHVRAVFECRFGLTPVNVGKSSVPLRVGPEKGSVEIRSVYRAKDVNGTSPTESLQTPNSG